MKKQKLKINLSEPVMVAKVTITEIVINPEKDVIRLKVQVGNRERFLVISGGDYDAVISLVDLEGISLIMQSKLKAIATSLVL